MTHLESYLDSLTSGIVGERSTLVSSRDTFIAMRNNEAFYPTWDFRGKGVSTQSTGSQTALVEKGWFENCPQGIMANNTRLRATENKMLQVETGIWASLGNAGGITISDNHIEAAHLGIVASHPDPNGTVTITGNYVVTDTENAVAGILEIFSMSPTLLNTDTVVVKEAGTGIWGYGARRIFMRDNRVEMDDPSAAVAGIFLLGVEQSLLETNTILGTGATGADNIALHITSSPGNVYCCNTLDNTRLGAYVTGGSVATDNFRGTHFSNHEVSLLLPNVNAILGSQTHAQNCWGANAGPAVYGTNVNNPVPVNIAEEYSFTVDPNILSCFLPEEHAPMEWFRSEEDIEFEEYVCASSECELDMFAPESDDVKRIAIGDTTTAPAVMWELQRYIYGRLQGESVQNASILAFLAHADTNSIGAFYAISRSISELLAADSLEVAQLQTNLEMVEEKLDSIVIIDELLPEADSLEFIALQNEKNGLLNTLYDLAGENQDIVGQLLDFISDEAGKLRTQNDSIAVTEIYEVNEKGFNDIYLSWLSTAFGALDSTEAAALAAIAEQCPIEGGNAVYRARAFLAALRQEYVTYNDSLLCAPIELLTVRPDNEPQLQIAKDEAGLSIFPNPASNEVKLVWSKSDENPGLVQVSDIYGRQVRQLVIASGTTEQVIQLAGLPDGVYVFRIRLNGRDTVRKVIIQR
ncbi:MAG: T9SS type A sorting domain-containing protein [Saprospiraceae bacterium]|nr:T9SS type A sorting domain-containing protein [Saprospiraceae bacterium]